MKENIKAFKTIEVNVINPDFFKVGEAYRWVKTDNEAVKTLLMIMSNLLLRSQIPTRCMFILFQQIELQILDILFDDQKENH